MEKAAKRQKTFVESNQANQVKHSEPSYMHDEPLWTPSHHVQDKKTLDINPDQVRDSTFCIEFVVFDVFETNGSDVVDFEHEKNLINTIQDVFTNNCKIELVGYICNMGDIYKL